MDIDEFVNVHVGDRTLSALLDALPEATAIPLTWRLFGNAGVVRYDDLPVTETFTRAAPAVLYWPWRAMLFKTLYRNDGAYRKLGVHRPRSPDAEARPRWFDGSGRELPTLYHRGRIFSPLGQDNHRLVQLNHYALGAVESYLVKADRGRAVHGADRLGMDYWVERNFEAVEDRTILGLDSRPLREALLRDPVLGPLHHAAVAWRKARFATLMGEDGWRGLYGRLLMTPPSRILPRSQAETIWKPWARVISTQD